MNRKALPQPIIRPVPFKRKVELVEDFTIDNFRFPAGTQWDGSTIPWYAWPIAGSPFEPMSLAASLAHDVLYRTRLLPLDAPGAFQTIERVRADAIYWDLCLRYGVPTRFARRRYWALRVFGGRYWRNGTPSTGADD